MGTDSDDCVQRPIHLGSHMFQLAAFVILLLSAESSTL